jgi:glucosamine kinase
MATDIFIGVDGGGTKTKVHIEHTNRELIAEGRGGPSAIRLSVEKGWQAILETINEALSHTDISLDNNKYHFHAGMGLSGCEVPEDREAFVNFTHPFTTLRLESDAYCACVGAHDGADGAIIIVGTGSVGYQIEGDKHTKTGGWGFPHSDEGSGAWLGLELCSITLKWLDGRISPSPLLEAVYQHFDNDLPKLIMWATRGKQTDFASLVPILIEYTKKNDPWAIKLIQHAADEIDNIGAAQDKEIVGEDSLPCSLFGGIAPFIEPLLGNQLRSRLTPRKHDATDGAIIMIRRELGLDI